MKRTILLLAIAFFAANFSLKAQNPCNGQLPAIKFNQKIEMLRNMKNENMRLAKMKELASEYCLTTDQVKQGCEILIKDFNRLDFVETAYINIVDKENFYEVYDAFSKFSSVMRLHDFVQNFTMIIPTEPPHTPHNPNFPHNPNNPPPPLTPCYVGQADFQLILESIKKEAFSETKVSLTKQILSSKNCFTTSQIKEMVQLFDFEEPKLEIAKYAYDYCIDKQN